MRDVKECCGTCRYCKIYQGEWMCYNAQSEFYCCYCDFEDSCEDWEGR